MVDAQRTRHEREILYRKIGADENARKEPFFERELLRQYEEVIAVVGNKYPIERRSECELLFVRRPVHPEFVRRKYIKTESLLRNRRDDR